MLEAGISSLVRKLSAIPAEPQSSKVDFSLAAGSKSKAANQNEPNDVPAGPAVSGGSLVAQAMPMPLPNPAGAAWAAKFAEAAFPLVHGAAPAVAKFGFAAAIGALLSSGGEELLGRVLGHIPSNVSSRELQLASRAMDDMGVTAQDLSHLSSEQRAFFVKTAAVAVEVRLRGEIDDGDYRAALQTLLAQASQLEGLPTTPQRTGVSAPPPGAGVLLDDAPLDEARGTATTFNAQNAHGGRIAIPVPRGPDARGDGTYTVLAGSPDQLAETVGKMKMAGLVNGDFDLKEAATSVGQDWDVVRDRAIQLAQPSPIVISEGRRITSAPRGLSAGEQQRLGLAGPPVDPGPPVEIPRTMSTPTEQPVPPDFILKNPRGSGPVLPSHTGSPSPGDDLSMPRTTYPLGGESIPVPIDGDSGLTTAPQSIAEVTGRLTANPPLTVDEKGELIALALGANPDNPDSRRHLEVALAKIGLAGAVGDIPAVRRAVQNRLGVSSADELVVKLTGSVTLPGLLRQYPEVGDAVLTRPKTIEALGQHPKALLELQDILRDLGRQDPLAIRIPPLPAAPRSNLTAGQIAISQAASAAVPQEDYLRNQPGFDPAWRSNPEMVSQYLTGLYESAAAATPEFSNFVNSVANATNGTAVLREEPKSRKRAMDKIEKYDGDASRLTDLVAGRLYYDRISDIYNAVEQIAANPNVEIVDFEDRILNPQPSGYRDVTMKIQMANGHIAELQIGLTSIGDYAKDVEHALYEVYRDLAANAKRTGTGITDSARFIMNSIRNRTIPEYNRLFEEANRNDTYGPELPRNR
jgi:ppGpp synthetase/RelA/SpoT-type nucleotidyltranferase